MTGWQLHSLAGKLAGHWSVTEAAKQLSVSRVALSRLINEKSGILPEMALKIENWLGVENGGRAELWAGMQLDYDMWNARLAA